VAEHAAEDRRGYDTSWIQTTATLGLFLALAVIFACRANMTPKDFTDWGWRLPFLVSLILLVFSVYIRLKLQESPVFQKIKSQGQTSKAPLTESFANWGNAKIVILALIGATAGQGVVWYTGQFYALFFLTITLKLNYESAYMLIALSLLIGTPFFVVFGWLSDKIGRKKIIMAGCLLAVLTYFPLFKALTHYVNPALEEASAKTKISVAATDCQFHIFVGPWSRFSDCDRTKDFLTKQGISFTSSDLPAGSTDKVVTRIGDTEVRGWNEAELKKALAAAGFPATADKSRVNWFMTEVILVIMVIYVTMVYGPIAAFLVELFPARIRYTSMSLPYHIGNGWFGGMLPLLATAMVAAAGDIYYGLWYPIIVALMTFVVGSLLIKETKDHKVRVDL
jgi:MFS family permease